MKNEVRFGKFFGPENQAGKYFSESVEAYLYDHRYTFQKCWLESSQEHKTSIKDIIGIVYFLPMIREFVWKRYIPILQCHSRLYLNYS